MNTEIVAGEIIAVHSILGMIAVALREERTRRFILPLAESSMPLVHELLGAYARFATVALRVQGALIVELIGQERGDEQLAQAA